MTTEAKTDETGGHGAPPGSHPTQRLYVTIWLVLMSLTVITVGVTYLDLKKFALYTALLVATTKAALVSMYFMHLRFESKIFAIFLLVGLGSFGVFLALTFSDVLYRFGGP